jgi:hypothetical protein
MKLNWGWKIAILYSGFVVFMLILVFKSSMQKIDLVTPDYYAKELNYQQQIDKENRTGKLSEQLKWQVENRKIQLQFPAEVKGKKVKGEILFYRPSDSGKDLKVEITPDSSGYVLVAGDKLSTGMYKMQVAWSADNTEYYNEGTITIN